MQTCSGSIGISNSNPAYRLGVSGLARFTGGTKLGTDLSLPSDNGLIPVLLVLTTRAGREGPVHTLVHHFLPVSSLFQQGHRIAVEPGTLLPDQGQCNVQV